MEPFLGQIIMFGGNFAPRGWAFCDGQLLPISANSALFSILGTTYGGDGRTTFGLPEMRGRLPLHPGNGPGLPSYHLGQRGGRNDVTLLTSNLPSHNHDVGIRVAADPADTANPNNKAIATSTVDMFTAVTNDTNLVPLSPNSVTQHNVGANIPFEIDNPYIAVNFIIALQGLFPSRS
ncbi:phage tail protein [Planktotalea sp.]|uniref:phage tail protein n=1 Tax=Planktotalea sp. TaxID=2029877 RepID=UPI003D6BDCCE